ncbi:MAG: helix-turn-helix domain-containing protein [Desulfobacterales bacterium]|nr:helix-turn-helix domain-containing protein [Desulfobacterales bacterium]
MDAKKNKTLNIDKINTRLEVLGMSQTDLADVLDVSRQSVTNWLQGKKFPRPAALLKMGKTLGLAFNEIVIKKDTSLDPVVAFRKKGSHKISAEYVEDAKDKGYLLEHLTPYLPYDNLSAPPALISPGLDYEYIQAAAAETRKHLVAQKGQKIEFQDLINFFNTHHAVLIPVFWGNKSNHENALHIYLPRSRTTWIYLNLDSKVHDFKFWMAHELGHVKAPELQSEEAEDFADQFAGALLFSKAMAEKEYKFINTLSTKKEKLARIREKAEALTISPLTVYYEINRYAAHSRQPELDFEKKADIFKVNTAFCNQYKNVADHLFDTLPPTAEEYIRVSQDYFNSPFFRALKKLIIEKERSVGFLQNILNIPVLDARVLYQSLIS